MPVGVRGGIERCLAMASNHSQSISQIFGFWGARSSPNCLFLTSSSCFTSGLSETCVHAPAKQSGGQ